MSGPAAAAPLRVLVVDDEAPARRRLVRLLAALPGVALAGEADSGAAAVRALAGRAVDQLPGDEPPDDDAPDDDAPHDDARVDVVLLDIQMPVLDGFGVVAAVGAEAMPPVIFQTAHDEHALRAFEVRAIDYLLKPVAPARLAEALDRVRARRLEPAAAAVAARARLADLVEAHDVALRRLLVHDARGARLLPVDAIWLARAERNYVALHTTDGCYRVRGTIGALARRLDPQHFLQVNRSDVVRIDAIRALHPWSHGDYRIVLPDGSALLWSRRFRARQAGRFALE